MKGLFACVKKDIRLLIGSGKRTLVMLLLPLLLVTAMFFGMADMANQRTEVSSFPIAVRDLDDTLMSRMLIGQINSISSLTPSIWWVKKVTKTCSPNMAWRQF